MPIRAHIERFDAGLVSGWAYDPAHPAARLAVEVLSEGSVAATAVADRFRADLARVGFGDGHAGFMAPLPPGLVLDRCTVIARRPGSAEVRSLRPPRNAAGPAAAAHRGGVVDFPADQASRLRPHGVLLTALRGPHDLGQETYFEPPVEVHASITTGIQIGSFTGVFGGRLWNSTVGRYCSIAPDVSIGLDEHPTDWLTTCRIASKPTVHDWDAFARPGRRGDIEHLGIHFAENHRRTVIGNDVWIGTRSLVLKGVRIGDGAVVAGGSVVTRDVPPYAIVAGAPARVVRMRFDDGTIERLLALRWWRFALHDLVGMPLDRMPAVLDGIEAKVAAGELAEWRPEKVTPARLRELLSGGGGAGP